MYIKAGNKLSFGVKSLEDNVLLSIDDWTNNKVKLNNIFINGLSSKNHLMMSYKGAFDGE